MKKYLLMGPMPPAYTGQSVAFSSVVKALMKDRNNECDILDLSNKDSISSGIRLCLKIMYKIIFKKYDIVYFTCSRRFVGSIRDVVLLFFCKLKRIRVVNHLHGDNFKEFLDSQFILYRIFLKWVYKAVDVSIVLLDKMKYNFSDFPNMDVRVVANGYSSDLDVLPLIKEIQLKATLNVLYMSNIMKTKGILLLLEAFKSFVSQSQEHDIHLVITGDFIGDYLATQGEIKELFFDKYLEIKYLYPDKIDYIGVVSGVSKVQVLKKTDIFILPTFHVSEAFPISIIEAMRAGNYIISTRHNYIPEIVSQDNGTLVEPNSVEDIEQALGTILSDKERLLAVQNHNIDYAKTNYNEQIYLQGVLNIIHKIDTL